MYLLSDYNYDLPEEMIAQFPASHRDGAKLLRLDKNTGNISHHRFREIENILRPDDLLVINNTKVIPARLKGKKETGGKVEVLIIDYYQGLKQYEKTGFFQCDCLVKASKSPRKGSKLFFGEDSDLSARVEKADNGIFQLKFFTDDNFPDILKARGEVPLPPYIKRHNIEEKKFFLRGSDDILHDKIRADMQGVNDSGKNKICLDRGIDNIDNYDRENYQTVYAENEGAVAAPTAGLHFTRSLMKKLKAKGVEFAELTLHVGYGTFVPVRVNDIRDHKIHSEFFSLSQETAEKINRAKDKDRRIIAVGTTSVRTLEFLADDNGRLSPKSGMCDLFIYPGYKFKIIDAMITNFHLPQSTLLMLVSAFAGRKNILSAYEKAVASKYRFFSYGDAMLID